MMQFAVWHTNGDDEPKTMNRIAKALNMTPSPHVRDMLLELVSEGQLEFMAREKTGRWTARGYYPVIKRLITEKYGKRRIVVKQRGAVVGQMELGL